MVRLWNLKNMLGEFWYLPLLVFAATKSQPESESWTSSPPWFKDRAAVRTPSFAESNVLTTQEKNSIPQDDDNMFTNFNPWSTALSSAAGDSSKQSTVIPSSRYELPELTSYDNEILPGPAPSLTHTPFLPTKLPTPFDNDLSLPNNYSHQMHPTMPTLVDRYPTSYQNSNLWTSNTPQPSNYPFIVSPYQNQGAPSNYYIVAVPKPTDFPSNSSIPSIQFTTPKPTSSTVEIVKSIEVPYGSRPTGYEAVSRPAAYDAGSRPATYGPGSRPAAYDAASRPAAYEADSRPAAYGAASRPVAYEAGSRPTAYGAASRPAAYDATSRPVVYESVKPTSTPKPAVSREPVKSDIEKENKKTKRSDIDQAASTSLSTSLFRPETINGFRALFKNVEPIMTEKNITIVDNEEMVLDKNLTGPVFYTKNAINIFVQDPGLVNVMQAKFSTTSPPETAVNGYQYPYPTIGNSGFTKRVWGNLN